MQVNGLPLKPLESFMTDIRSPNMSSDIEMSDQTRWTWQNLEPQVEPFHGHMEGGQQVGKYCKL